MLTDGQLLIHSKATRTYQKPTVESGFRISTSADFEPGKLTFKVEKKGTKTTFKEGDAVWFYPSRFKGYIFEITDNSDAGAIEYTAYDQLRYMKAKDTYVFSKSYSPEHIFQKICQDYKLSFTNFGLVANNTFKYGGVWENVELLDIMKDIADHVLKTTGKKIILMDDMGKVCWRPLGHADGNLVKAGAIVSMRAKGKITLSSMEGYEYSSNINDTYNQVKVFYDNDSTGKREVYIAKDSNSINKWGLLSTAETMQKGELGQSKANNLLRLYNHQNKNLELKNVLSDGSLRAGQLIKVEFTIPHEKFNHWFMIKKCEHTVNETGILSNLTLQGGEFGG